MSDGNRSTERNQPFSGLRIGIFNNIVVFIAVILSVLLLSATYQSINGYNSLQRATERYITCQQSAVHLQEGSDYPTNESRLFAVTGDLEHARNFVREVEETRRRETALEAIDRYEKE